MDVDEDKPEILIAIVALEAGRAAPNLPKGLASSLGRSLFGGRIIVFRNDEAPLFRVERRNVDEVTVTVPTSGSSNIKGKGVNRTFLFRLCQHLAPAPRQCIGSVQAI